MKKTVLNMAMAAAMVLPVTALAAAPASKPNGALDSQSDAISTISLTIPKQTRIFGLGDLKLTPAATASTASAIDSAVCIYTNANEFTVTAVSYNNEQSTSKTNGFWELKGSGNTGANYSVSLLPKNSDTVVKKWPGANNDAVTAVALGATDEAYGTLNCATGNFRVQVNANLNQRAPAGSYTDTVTLTVAAN